MRKTFFEELTIRMNDDLRIIAVTADLGKGGFDNIRDRYPDRFFNVGAAEHTAINICIGLALNKRIPFFYSITPFALYRPFESIRNYINHEKIPVKIIGSGRDKDYKHDGWSHDATDVKCHLANFKHIKQYWPEKKEEIPGILGDMINNDKPCFLSLER